MKILIIHTAFIGDIVLSTPMISKIAEEYPKAKIFYLTTPAGATILKNNPHLYRIISYDKKGAQKSWKSFWNLAMSLRQEKFDLVFCPHRYLRSSLLSILTGAKEKIGYKTAALSFLFSKKIAYRKDCHEVERLLSFVKTSQTKHYEISLFPDEKDKQLWKKTKEEMQEGSEVLVIAAGSRWKTKQWPLEYFQKVIDEIQKTTNIALVLVGGKEEKEMPFSWTRGVWDLRGETTLLELTAILQEADYVLTNDSSPIHIASSSPKAKIIALFGPTVRSFGFTPWSRNSVVLEEELYCRPCGLHGGDTCPEKHFRCMRDLLPERVLEEIKKN